MKARNTLFAATLSLVALAFAVQTAFAFGPGQSGMYRGGGEWKMADGTASTWSAVMTVTHEGDEVIITDKVSINAPDGTSQDEEMSWRTVSKGNGFYDVVIDGQTVGTSYCFETVCHLEIGGGVEQYEETFRFDGNKVLRSGSTNDHGKRVAWTGVVAAD